MNSNFHDPKLWAVGLLLVIVLAWILIFWLTGRLKETYTDRARLLIYRIYRAQTVEELYRMEDELDLMYEEFYDQDPENVTAARIYLAGCLDARIKEKSGLLVSMS